MKVVAYLKKRQKKKKERLKKMSTRERVWKEVKGYSIYILIILALIWGLPKVLRYTLKTDYPLAAITSGSMWPTLKKNDLVLICHIEPSEIQVGDIIVFSNLNNTLAIHRVIEAEENTIITKGDANPKNDNPIERAEVLGKLCSIGSHNARIPKIGLISNIVHKQL